jgi:hypothetical protein
MKKGTRIGCQFFFSQFFFQVSTGPNLSECSDQMRLSDEKSKKVPPK